ncbi:outer membrane protein assembly factor BamB [Uliginosibacterium sp. 31-16]|uniref:outer membrane protein assembly factor BamB n=1 Tax=Uliginosibacterium sp. 31-16 TaxID=3068315 RepID=UPI00273E8D90|nr:outer membrane protein assembly factor BamB [Uliginosibacterium sp. 31-16]MDP5241003.1 outer membrane protein assembly factor BamB [Uliginosibacterium sp. 31-16]
MKLRAFVVLVLASSLGGCFLWSSSKGPQPSPLPVFNPSGALREQWHSGVGSIEESMLRPALAGGSVYAASRSGTLMRFDATGRELWRVKTAARLTGGVGSDSSVVVVASSDGMLLAHDADKGGLRWKVAVEGEVLASPLVTGDLVVVRVGDNLLAAYGVADGKRRWIYQRAQSPLALRNYAGLLQAGDLLVAGFPGGKLVAVSAGGGVQRWEATIAQPKGSNELERMTDVVGTPVLRGDAVCVAAFQGRVACVDRDSGVVRWTRDFSSAVGVDADATALYVTDATDAVYSLDASNGATNWKQDKLLHRRVGRPAIVGNSLVVADAEGYMHVLSRQDGRFISRLRADSSGISAPLLQLPNNAVAVQARDGSLYAFSVPQ